MVIEEVTQMFEPTDPNKEETRGREQEGAGSEDGLAFLQVGTAMRKDNK